MMKLEVNLTTRIKTYKSVRKKFLWIRFYNLLQ